MSVPAHTTNNTTENEDNELIIPESSVQEINIVTRQVISIYCRGVAATMIDVIFHATQFRFHHVETHDTRKITIHRYVSYRGCPHIFIVQVVHDRRSTKNYISTFILGHEERIKCFGKTESLPRVCVFLRYLEGRLRRFALTCNEQQIALMSLLNLSRLPIQPPSE